MARNIKVMGIINVTDDSYFSESRCNGTEAVLKRAEKMAAEGADIFDIGGCSTRPGAKTADEDTEWQRLAPAITAIRKNFPEIPLSIDTFRSGIVAKAHDSIGEFTVNDISAGEADRDMLATVGRLGLPYIAMHMRGTPETMQGLCCYNDITAEITEYFRKKTEETERAGITDCTLDPGFGFAKTIDQNYELLHNIGKIKKALGRKILVGISRKSMIYRLFNIAPEDALPATQALHMEAMIQGADILRVHDVAEAVQCRTIYCKLYGENNIF